MKNDNSNTSLKRGRPPKKDYDAEALMRELIDTAAEIYREKGEIKATALELDLPPGKVKKLLITGNVLSYPETKQIQDLMRQGKTMVEIQRIMGLSYSALHTYLPYTKVIYKMSEISQNAERVKAYKARKAAVDTSNRQRLRRDISGTASLPFKITRSIPCPACLFLIR